jgi:hypothetical protein
MIGNLLDLLAIAVSKIRYLSDGSDAPGKYVEQIQ